MTALPLFYKSFQTPSFRVVAYLTSVAEEAISIFCAYSFALASGLPGVRFGRLFYQNFYGVVVVFIMIMIMINIIVLIIIIIIIIIIIRHEFGLDRPVSASSDKLFKSLRSRRLPFCL